MTFEEESCIRAELSGFLAPAIILKEESGGQPKGFCIKSENPAVAGRVIKLFKTLKIQVELKVSKIKEFNGHRTYEIVVKRDAQRILKELRITAKESKNIEPSVPVFFKSKQKLIKAYIRGVFLACGSVTNPEKDYHMELVSRHRTYLKEVGSILSQYGIRTSLIKRKNTIVLYTKESESVTTFLNIIGANKALMELENIRVVKELRNEVNRKVNCDVSNLRKLSDAAQTQISAIRKIQEKIGLETLPENLMKMAQVRLENPDLSIKELGELLIPPVGKSGVYHRLVKLTKMAEELS